MFATLFLPWARPVVRRRLRRFHFSCGVLQSEPLPSESAFSESQPQTPQTLRLQTVDHLSNSVDELYALNQHLSGKVDSLDSKLEKILAKLADVVDSSKKESASSLWA